MEPKDVPRILKKVQYMKAWTKKVRINTVSSLLYKRICYYYITFTMYNSKKDGMGISNSFFFHIDKPVTISFAELYP